MVLSINSENLAVALADEINHPRIENLRDYVVVAKEQFSLGKPSSNLKQIYDVMAGAKVNAV